MVGVPTAIPREPRRDVVAVARRREAPISRIAKAFGTSESCLQRWLEIAEVEVGVRSARGVLLCNVRRRGGHGYQH